MNAAPVRLYIDARFTSPYAMSVFVALREKDIDFELMKVDLHAARHRAKGYADLSLTQRVPMLVDGDFSLSESSAITEYLEDRFAQTPIYPRDVQQRARARQVQAWLRSDLVAIREERSTLVVFYGRQYPPLSSDGQAAADKLISAAQALLADGQEHLFGEWSIADVDLALMLNRLILNGDEVPAPLVQYTQRQWQRATVQEWVGQQRPPL